MVVVVEKVDMSIRNKHAKTNMLCMKGCLLLRFKILGVRECGA